MTGGGVRSHQSHGPSAEQTDYKHFFSHGGDNKHTYSIERGLTGVVLMPNDMGSVAPLRVREVA